MGYEALHKALTTGTGLLHGLPLPVAREWFTRVGGRERVPLSDGQVLRVCALVKERWGRTKYSEAAVIIEVIRHEEDKRAAEAIARQPPPSPAVVSAKGTAPAVKPPLAPLPPSKVRWSTIADVLKRFGLAPDLALMERFVANAASDASAESYGTDEPIVDVAALQAVFDSRRGSGSRGGERLGHSASRAGTQRAPPDATRRMRRAPSVVSSTDGSPSLVSGDTMLDDDLHSPAGSEHPRYDDVSLASRLKSLLSHHSHEMRNVRGRAQREFESVGEGPGGQYGTWAMNRSNGTIAFSECTSLIRPNVLAAANKMREIRGLPAALAPRPASASPSPSHVGNAHQKQPQALASKAASQAQRSQQRPLSAGVARATLHTPTSAQESPTRSRPLSASSGGHRPGGHNVAVSRAWESSFEKAAEKGELREAVDAYRYATVRPRSALAERVPRSRTAAKLHETLPSKSINELAARPTFALAPEVRWQLLDARKHIHPAVLLGRDPRPTMLHMTRDAAKTVLDKMAAWHPPTVTGVGASRESPPAYGAATTRADVSAQLPSSRFAM
jgi:hypothetical protein